MQCVMHCKTSSRVKHSALIKSVVQKMRVIPIYLHTGEKYIDYQIGGHVTFEPKKKINCIFKVLKLKIHN